MDTIQEPSGSGLMPETLALVRQVEANMPRQESDEFTRISEGLFDLRVCTSLTDEDATARVNEVPSGTRHGWVLNLAEGFAPVPCDDRPDTHRYLMFEA